MDNFDDAFGSAPPPMDEVDPAAEFLAKEQEELGDMQEDFGIAAATVIPAAQETAGEPVVDFEEELGAAIPVTANYSTTTNLFDAPPSSYQGEGGLPELSSKMSTMEVRVEPECLKKWKLEQEERLKAKDAEEEVRKEELREKARKELEDWYKLYEERLAKSKANNREKEEEFVAEVGGMNHITPGSEWERVAKHCDFSAKAAGHTKDVSRMRSILLQLKQNPPQNTRD